MSTPPLTVTADSRLSDDVMLVEPLSASPDALAPAALDLANDGTAQLLAVLATTGAAELSLSTSSTSGYDIVPLPEGCDATEIVGAVDSGGVLHAFYAVDAAVMHSERDSGGEWSSPDSLPPASGLAATTVPLSGDIVVSGVSKEGGQLVLFQSAEGAWSGTEVDVGGGLVGASARIQYLLEGAWVLFAAVAGQLQIWDGSGTAVSAGPERRSVENPVSTVLATYYHSNSAMVVFTDSKGGVYSSVGFSDDLLPVPTSTGVTNGGAAVGTDGFLRFYGADGYGTLWVLRQTSWDESDAPVWAPIFPLDQDVQFVATPVATHPSGALFVARAGGSLDLLQQSDVTGLWNRTAVQGGGGTVPLRTTRYRTVLSVVDANGAPCPGAGLTVSPSDLVALDVGGGTVVAAPDSPAALTADLAGMLEFSQPAAGLASVTFSVGGQGIPSAVEVTPYDYLHAQLSGAAPLFTGSVTVPPMSAPTLQAATADGQPLVASDVTPDQVSVAANGIMQAIGTAAGAPSGSAGFELDLRSRGSPAFALLETRAELDARLRAFRAEAGDDPWDEIVAFPEDVWNAIKTGAIVVEHWVVDTTDKVVSATVRFANGVTADLERLVLAGVGEITSLVHGIFNWVGATLEKVLDWLKDLFDWDSVWATMEAFNGLLSRGLETTVTWLGSSAVVATGNFFSDLRTKVDECFDDAIAGLGQRPLQPPAAVTVGAARGGTSGPIVTLPGSDAQHRWLLGKVTAYLPASQFLDPLESGLSGDLISQAQQAIDDSNITTDGAAALADFESFFSDLFSAPRDLCQVLAADLLAAARDLINVILDALHALVTFLLELAADAVKATQSILETRLPEIPLLTWLWDDVLRPSGSSDPMTLGTLLCLLLALPVTLACKLVTGHGPFDAADPSAPDPATGQVADHADAGDSNGLVDAQVYGSLALAFVDIVNDAATASSGDEPNPLLLIWNWFDVVSNGVIQALFWPTDSNFNDGQWSQMTYGQQLTNGTWIGYWAPIYVDASCAAIETDLLRQGESAPEALTYVNQTLDWILGLTLVGVGVAGAVYELKDSPPNATWEDVLEAALGPLPWGTQWLLYPALVESSDGLSTAVQCFVDFLGDVDFEDSPSAA